MYRIVTRNNISAAGLDMLPRDRFEVASDLNAPHGMVVRSAKLHDETFPASLLAIARAGAGVNNIPVDQCADNGIVVFNTPGANAQSVMELTVAGMLTAARNLTSAFEYTKKLSSLEEDAVKKEVESGKKQYKGSELYGKTIGIIGLGQIGRKVAAAAHALGMNVVGFDPFLTAKSALELPREIELTDILDSLIVNSDFISVHVALTDDTKHMINAEHLKRTKPTLAIINFARGEIIEEDAVLHALRKNKVGAYVTDFPTKNLLTVAEQDPRVICLPHLGASTEESEDNCAVMACCQLQDFLANGNITNSVNFPNCEMERQDDSVRLTVLNKNIPNELGQITSALAEHEINILDMLNKSRGDYAYNIFDVSGPVSQEDITKLENINGVIKVRVID